MAFTPDGRRLATGGIAGTVTIRDVRSRAVVRRLRFPAPVCAGGDLARRQAARGAAPAHGGRVDGRGPRAALEHTRVRQDDRRGYGGACVHGRRPCPRRLVGQDRRRLGRPLGRAAAAGPRGGPSPRLRPLARLASRRRRICRAASVRLWDLRTGRPRGAAIKVAGSDIYQLAISPDGRLLAVGAVDGTAAVWDLRTRTRLGQSFTVVKGLAPNVVFKPDGRLIVGELVSAIEWPLDRPTLQRFACQVAGRDITRAEWEDVLPNQPYRRVCG